MTINTLFLVLALITPINISSTKGESRWIVTANSHLMVNGRTNINSFTCSISNYVRSDTITLYRERGKQIALNGKVCLDLKSFDCKNRIMTKQLRQTLKEDKFPYLSIAFLSLKGINLEGQSDSIVKGIVEIELAGNKRKFLITYGLNSSKDGITICGSKSINFSDFNLTPPHKVGKLLQAKDELVVSFELNLQPAK